jgi:uncharacterized membrane protein YjjP (DUF1212 family)
LACAGRLLLEYNESTGSIDRALTTTAGALTNDKCEVAVTYRGVAIELADGGSQRMSVREIRQNAALLARVHAILERVRSGDVESAAALEQLNRVEAETPGHPRWLTVLLLGVAGASLAVLLGADLATDIVTGVATSIGLVIRQELGRRHFSLLALPFVGGFVGAILGGIVVRLGWTQTPGLALIVPSLMIVPGTHLINGLLDLIDNFIPMSIARLALAASILVAIALGVVVAVEIVFPGLPPVEQSTSADCLNVVTDMVLAGVVTVGLAVLFNTVWPHVALAAVGGIAGHGLRFLALQAGWGLVPATFVGGAAVGVVAAWIARSYRIPLAVAAFAGAVTMMPGLQIYRALSGSLRIARLNAAADRTLIAGTLGEASQSWLVVIALAMGLIIASRVVLHVAGEQKRPKAQSAS